MSRGVNRITFFMSPRCVHKKKVCVYVVIIVVYTVYILEWSAGSLFPLLQHLIPPIKEKASTPSRDLQNLKSRQAAFPDLARPRYYSFYSQVYAFLLIFTLLSVGKNYIYVRLRAFVLTVAYIFLTDTEKEFYM